MPLESGTETHFSYNLLFEIRSVSLKDVKIEIVKAHGYFPVGKSLEDQEENIAN